MRQFFIHILAVIALSLSAVTASAQAESTGKVKQLIDQIRTQYAPDKRVAVFEIDFAVEQQAVTLKGRTTLPEAHSALKEALSDNGFTTTDQITLLPEKSLGEKIYGIINISTCALRSSANYSAEMVTQALMGMPVKIIERDGWYRIQTPDNYLAWTHRVGIHPVTRDELTAWNNAEKVIVTAHHGWVFASTDKEAAVISDVAGGCRLRYIGQQGGYYKVAYPDGREGYISKQISTTEKQWRAALKQDAESIVATAKTLHGIPYLWGGTSAKGADCSGFVRTTLFMHDIIIPRDASQQAYTGEHIDINSDFSNLQVGDLIFFGQKATATRRERVVHVGIYIGNKRFIHSQGDVRISSFDKDDELFDSYNLGRLLFAARVLPYVNKEPQLNTTATNPYYKL
ncbi:MAG: C40 family peptidase [Alistipes sp.]|nr:C40 family peptidase [Alistipes sp.]